MKRFWIGIVLFTGLMIYILACSKRLIKIEHFSDKGNLIEVYFITPDSLKTGEYKSFDPDGNIFESSFYKKDKLDGIRTIYFPNGQVEIQENYRRGIIHGLYRSFYDNGQVNVEAQYNDGVMEGLVRRFYYSGELMEEVSFKNNEENGPFKEYYKNGNLKWEGNYINGDNEIGALNAYDENGILIKKMECGKYKGEYICQTIWTIEDGDKALEIEYED